MTPPARRGARAVPGKRRPRLGTILLLVGVLTVLGTTFVVGALAGRLSLRPSAFLAHAPKAERERVAKPPVAEQPELTFYRELTAPLTPAPLPPKPAARPAAKREQPPAPETLEAIRHRDGDRAPSAAPPAVADGARYTVQVGAYNARAQADALRARLAAAGHEAYVTAADAGGVTRYRVRIGTYASADEARQAAGRIGAQAQVPTYVTPR